MSKSIYELVNELPQKNLTVFALRSLDKILPGEWENIVGFENTIRQVTGESDPALIEQIGARAIQLYNDKSEGYQRALWLYQTIDSTGRALGQAALAGKVTENVPFLSLVNRLTPKPEKAQTIDLCMKLVTEIVAFCKINGIPGDSVGDFVKALGDYGGESLVRMAALVCFDGLVPLGPNFIKHTETVLGNLTPKDLDSNPAFKAIKEAVPGNKTDDQLTFIGASFESVKGWMGDFVESKGITPQSVVANLKTFVDVADDKMDYFGAFLDISTNYYEHTGIQTLSRRLVERAVAEI
ncbi:hypothetical protein IQ260_20820 [Leptolyngbya cf. ectocarpi LEGE 11479]|uniref:Uncharacterized protein n=1 Tax=Leptolyngbya cf. ectocarpi LEGE 11479 TaxID=1828722 RepID=A0A928ZXA2_LEPEC|nr:hypothetical protein [Leptolyngbya ectocarpi]MBE9069093.1 hypothetical protein [Leptolyngbya cf. ectocarpi LEGE 11479]